MKKIGILGSTGSVGKQCLNLIKEFPTKFKVEFLTANSNVQTLIKQAQMFNPVYVCIADESKHQLLKKSLPGIEVLSGNSNMQDLCKNNEIDIILNSVSGYNGLSFSYAALNSGINLALANKESIVQAGNILMELSKLKGAKIFPVDSEHSAIWQCLIGEDIKQVKKIILTGSGGPFRKLPHSKFESITVKEALKHPNWEMGNKITIDSATMMNKGFEIIEAFWLFEIDYKYIDVVIHPQSIIHSMVEYIDGSIKAQLSEPTMITPIQFALSYPERYKSKQKNFDFIKNNSLTFYEPDFKKFPCLKLAYESGIKGGTYTTVLNVANDIAVDLFLNKKIKFIDIYRFIDSCINKHNNITNPSMDDIYNTRKLTEEYILKELI